MSAARINWRGPLAVSGTPCAGLSCRAIRSARAAAQARRGRAVPRNVERAEIVARALSFELVEEPEPRLREGERHHLRRGHRRRAGRAAWRLVERRRARRWWKLEHVPSGSSTREARHGIAAITCVGKQRVTAELEEVVVRCRRASSAEHLGPEAGKDLFSVAVRGGVYSVAGSWSGAGSALRSTLPLGVSGSASSTTKAAGTM